MNVSFLNPDIRNIIKSKVRREELQKKAKEKKQKLEEQES